MQRKMRIKGRKNSRRGVEMQKREQGGNMEKRTGEECRCNRGKETGKKDQQKRRVDAEE